MITNIAQYVDVNAQRVPGKIAFSNGKISLTYLELQNEALFNANRVLDMLATGTNIMVLMDRTPSMIAAMFSVWYAGCCVVPIDSSLPLERICSLAQKSDSKAIIYDEKYSNIALKVGCVLHIPYEQSTKSCNNVERINKIQKKVVDIEPAYIIFTSGSSGEPKGAVLSHRCLTNFAEALCEEIGYLDNYILAGQTPLYYVASLHEIMPGIKKGLTVYLLPNEILLFPVKIVEFLNENKVNVVSMVPSVLSRIAAYVDFRKHDLKDLRYILYGGESLSTKNLIILMDGLPNVIICSCYGLTEVTTTSCMWKSSVRKIDKSELVPIGFPLKNTKIVLLDQNNEETFEEGEVCFIGTCLANGYYNNVEYTRNSFFQNPLHFHYNEIVYRTGDIAKYNRYGELVFVGRRDSQIKRGGHRIELGDIETVASQNSMVELVCCVYLKEYERIILCYTGSVGESELLAHLKKHLPSYMRPSRILQFEKLPLLSNGKINRKEVIEIVNKS